MDAFGWVLLIAMAAVASPFACYVLAKVITAGVLQAKRQFAERFGRDQTPDAPDPPPGPPKKHVPPMIVNPNREE